MACGRGPSSRGDLRSHAVNYLSVWDPGVTFLQATVESVACLDVVLGESITLKPMLQKRL